MEQNKYEINKQEIWFKYCKLRKNYLINKEDEQMYILIIHDTHTITYIWLYRQNVSYIFVLSVCILYINLYASNTGMYTIVHAYSHTCILM